jgi:hypothetical protein
MRFIASLTLIAVLLAYAAAVADIVRHASVPDALRGTWAPSAEDCDRRDKDKDKSVITLAAKSYDGADGSCAVAWVSETPSPQGPRYSARLQCKATTGQEGASATNVLILPKDQNQVSMGPGFDSLKVYRRCPAK